VTLIVNQIKRRPIHVVTAVPGHAIIILSHRLFNPILGNGLFQASELGFAARLAEMVTDKCKSFVLMFACQLFNFMDASVDWNLPDKMLTIV